MLEEETKAPLEEGAEEPAEAKDGPKEAPSEPLMTTRTGDAKAADEQAMSEDEILGKFPGYLPLGAVLTIDFETRPVDDKKSDSDPVYFKYVCIGIGDGPFAATLGGNAVVLSTDELGAPVLVVDYEDFIGGVASMIAEGDGFVTDCGYAMPLRERPNMHMSAVLFDDK